MEVSDVLNVIRRHKLWYAQARDNQTVDESLTFDYDLSIITLEVLEEEILNQIERDAWRQTQEEES